MTPLAPEEHNAHAWAPDPATVPTLPPPCCHRLQRPSRTVAALLLGLDCQALLVCFPEVPPKSSPASPPLTQAERGSKLRGGGGLQEAGVPRPRWLSPQVPLQALSWPWCGSARWCSPPPISSLHPFPDQFGIFPLSTFRFKVSRCAVRTRSWLELTSTLSVLLFSAVIPGLGGKKGIKQI